MITLAIFINNNSIATFVATIESFFDKCKNRQLITEIIHIDDKSTIENIICAILKKSFSTNLLSDEPYAVHIGKYKNLL